LQRGKLPPKVAVPTATDVETPCIRDCVFRYVTGANPISLA